MQIQDDRQIERLMLRTSGLFIAVAALLIIAMLSPMVLGQ